MYVTFASTFMLFDITIILSHWPHFSGPLPERQLVHSIETVVIDWCHQVRDVLKKRSAQALLDGSYPGPLVEIDFWKARWDDLESIVEQVRFFKRSIIMYM